MSDKIFSAHPRPILNPLFSY